MDLVKCFVFMKKIVKVLVNEKSLLRVAAGEFALFNRIRSVSRGTHAGEYRAGGCVEKEAFGSSVIQAGALLRGAGRLGEVDGHGAWWTAVMGVSREKSGSPAMPAREYPG